MIFEKVKAIIVEQLGVEADDVTMESSFVEDQGPIHWTLWNLSCQWKISLRLPYPIPKRRTLPQ